MKKTCLTAAVMALIIAGTVSAQNLHRSWEMPAVPATFPVFLSSNPKLDIPLNDFYRRHYFVSPGPSAYTANSETFWREWDAISTVWLDTSRNKAQGRDYKLDLRDYLLRVQLDTEGYVHSYVPQQGIDRTMGWLIPDPDKILKSNYRWSWDDTFNGQQGWSVKGGGMTAAGAGTLDCLFTEPDACISRDVDMYAHESPILYVRMSASRAGTAAFEWTTDKDKEWSPQNRIQFQVSTKAPAAETIIPVYKHNGWRGKITAIRIRPLLTVPEDGITASFDLVEFGYDTRHVVNNTSFVLASHRYFMWTGDNEFLKLNMPRLRSAAHYLRSTLKGDADGIVAIPYWGHEGTSGVSPRRTPGFGLGSDSWDTLPMGYKSAYTNAYYVGALFAMAELEDQAQKLRLGTNPYGENGDNFRAQARKSAKAATEFFWDAQKKRFIGCEDNTGKRHDYGFTFVNLEALYYGLGDKQKAADIFSWLDGTRKIAGDTSTGDDIYRWRLAPRSTTLRNPDWWLWTWIDMKSRPFGSVVPDGGAAAYTSFYDIMDRIRFKSPDDAYSRMMDIMSWYYEVGDAGGYDAYYKKQGTTRFDKTVGPVGVGAYFTDTAMVPCSFLYGFVGLTATSEGLIIQPRIPKDLQYVGVRNLSYHGIDLTILASRGKITVKCTLNTTGKSFLVSGRRMTGKFERVVDGSYAVVAEAK